LPFAELGNAVPVFWSWRQHAKMILRHQELEAQGQSNCVLAKGMMGKIWKMTAGIESLFDASAVLKRYCMIG